MNVWKRTAPNEWPGVYISGPMSGVKDLNREMFDRAETILRSLGVENIFNPARQDRPESWTWEQHMEADLHELTSGRYSVLLQLPDCDCSRGAKVEEAVARACGIEVWAVRFL